MSSTSALQQATDRGWRSGFANLLRKENSLWWGTRKWWVQSLIWLVIVNGILAIILWADSTDSPPALEAVEPFIMIHGSMTAVGVMVLAQSAMVGEKRSGTAAWIMTNPVSRSAFLLSKLVGNAVGIFAVLVLLQGLIGYCQISLRGGGLLPPVDFVAAMGLLSLHLLFYLTLALMLGALFNSRGPVIGISIGVLLGQNLVTQLVTRWVPWLPTVIPERLLTLAVPVGQGQTLPSNWPIPVIVTFLMSLSFMAVAIWRFQREEF